MNKMKTMQDSAELLVGQKVAIMCPRYQYRGVLAEANADHIVLANAVSVEESGRAMQPKATLEDPIGTSLLIPYASIEIVYQPNFAHAPLPGEDDATPSIT
jgi:hypothetical protein